MTQEIREIPFYMAKVHLVQDQEIWNVRMSVGSLNQLQNICFYIFALAFLRQGIKEAYLVFFL